MAGTLTISTLSDGTNSTSSTNCIQGSAKAWVNFNGVGTPAIRSSYNVGSVTKSGTGIFQINFTNAMPDANYSASGTSHYPGTASTTITAPYGFGSSTTSIPIGVLVIDTGALIDASYVSLQIFR